MRAHLVLAHVETFGDLVVRQPLIHLHQHVQFAARQRLDLKRQLQGVWREQVEVLRYLSQRSISSSAATGCFKQADTPTNAASA